MMAKLTKIGFDEQNLKRLSNSVCSFGKGLMDRQSQRWLKKIDQACDVTSYKFVADSDNQVSNIQITSHDMTKLHSSQLFCRTT